MSQKRSLALKLRTDLTTKAPGIQCLGRKECFLGAPAGSLVPSDGPSLVLDSDNEGLISGEHLTA